MDVFLRAAGFLWILLGFLSLSGKSEACPGDGSPALCEFVFKNVCFDLVGGSMTWSQAQCSCEEQGGELLKMLNNPVKKLLTSVLTAKNASNSTFWLEKGVQGFDLEPTVEDDDILTEHCTYVKLNPLELITTSDCNQRHGSLCTHNVESLWKTKKTLASDHATRLRLKRNVWATVDIMNIHNVLQTAKTELRRMETTHGEPTDAKRDLFIKSLLDATKTLTEQFATDNKKIMDEILNCSTAILQLATKKCDIQPHTSLFEKVFEIVKLVGLLLNKESEVEIEHPTGTLYQNSYNPQTLSNAVIGSEKKGEYVKFPPSSVLESQLEGATNVITQMTTFANNPHPTDENITGPVFKIILSDGIKDINLKNLPEMIEMFIPRPNSSQLNETTIVLEENKKAVIEFNVSDPYVTIFISVKPNVNISLDLALAHGSPPNETYFSNKTVLSQNGGYRWKIPPEMLRYTTGTWFVDAQLVNSTWEPGLALKIAIFMSKCMYWNTDKNSWCTDGCQVGDKSSSIQTQCLCNHLTLFGSSFFVMPNYVDISRTAELFATVSKNYVVLALLCAFFGLYLITLLWACYADRKARSRRKMTLLEDNHPAALYNYLISVQTSNRKNAGTSADVTVKLVGTDGESNIHNLTDPDKPVFQRGAVDVFLLAVPFPLGEIQTIRLQHNNSGGHPSWYVNKVIIQDLQTRHVWHFFCGCWLSGDRGDHMTKKTFNAAKSNEIASFRNIFQSRTTTGFRDEHIWVSIVDPPSRSPFTRAQRVSCCMSLLLCTMAINIAFWNIPIDEDSAVLFSMGSLSITWQELMVGIQSGLLMFPINILIITIFRSIKPRIVSDSKKGDPEVNLAPPPITMASVLKDTEEVISLVSRSPKNNMSMGSLESSADIYPTLEKVHELIRLMQGQTESNSHWVNCSRFILAALCHLVICLEKLDVNNFSTTESFKQTLEMANQLVRKAEMVFSSHLSCCPPPVVKKKKKTSGGCWLPWWCVFLGWFLLLSISGVSTFFTLLYGFQYGRDKSIKWVMSLGLSLFQSIFILQPLKVIGIAVFFALLLKPVSVEETDEVGLLLLAQQEKCRRYSGRATL